MPGWPRADRERRSCPPAAVCITYQKVRSQAGAAIGEKERIRTGPGTQAVLRLADGSTVDVNERTELFVTAAWSGLSIHLLRGDVIVKAASSATAPCAC